MTDVSDRRATPAPPRFELSGGALCLDFANSWGDRRRPESDRLGDYGALLAFACEAGLLDRRQAARLHRRARGAPAEAARAYTAARELRDALYRLFSARARRRRVEPADVAHV